MNHEYSTQQIEEASRLASNGYNTRIGTNFLLNFLDFLPEQKTDEWEPCEYGDYRPGDRMMRENNQATIAYKSPIREVHEHYVELEDKNVHHFRTDMTYYRIPAPVHHPDPAEHPVIIIYRPNGNGETLVSNAWTGQYYRTFDGREYFSANEITEWSPAKVVEDER